MNTTFQQLKDIFAIVDRVHKEVAGICASAGEIQDERLKLMVKFFLQWENRLVHGFESLPTEEKQPLLDTWVQFAGTEELDNAVADLRQCPRGDPDKLLSKCFQVQSQILDLLRELSGSQPVPEVREKLSRLAEFEETATRNLSAAVVTSHDV